MAVREMTIGDYTAVYQLWMSCAGMGLNHLDDSQDGIARFLDRNPHTCFVEEADGGILGVIMAGHDGRRGYIYHTSVHPSARRRGIGSKLVSAALHALDGEGIHKVALLVFRSNEDGNCFWEKQGFALREDVCYRNRALCELERIDT